MNILVIGANNFIADELINYYLKKICNIYIISRRYNHKIEKKRFININNLEENINSISNLNFDCVFYFINQKSSKKKILKKDNSVLWSLIPFLKKLKIEKFIYFSSISVYQGLKSENINSVDKIKPISTYAMNKLFEEKLIIKELSHFTNCILLRIPMVIGKNMKSNVFSFLNYYLKYKLYKLIHNPNCIINYISSDKLIYYIHDQLFHIKDTKIINLSFNISFSEIYLQKNIKIKKNFINFIFNFFLKKLIFISVIYKIYFFFLNYQKIQTNVKAYNTASNNNEFINLIK